MFEVTLTLEEGNMEASLEDSREPVSCGERSARPDLATADFGAAATFGVPCSTAFMRSAAAYKGNVRHFKNSYNGLVRDKGS